MPKSCLDKIIEASQNLIENKTRIFPDGSKEIRCVTNDGMIIEMYVTHDRILKSVYPVFE